MRTLAIVTLLAGFSVARADDDFLKPDNWEGVKEYWKIEGDTIIGKTDADPKYNNFLISKKKYKNFEMSFQARLKDGKGNSGIQFRSTVTDDKKFVVGGPQADIGAAYWGSLYGEKFSKEGKIGGGHMMKASDFKKLNVKGDDFNDYSLKVVGTKVTITVNGVAAVDQEFAILPEEGVIAIQIHAGSAMEVTLKNIKFKELK
ncbi:MAG: DUF1080 domain-containing protein [Planctomycetes bacterium]|nr:DUF1080 domain-containing protein [Planctomycetota bacterium]